MMRLLLVDDERSFAESLAMLIRRELHEEFEVVGFAATGREAIEKVSSLSPDIVVMDLRMPGLSGLDAIRELRDRGASPLFILLTAYERFDTAREAVSLGVADYLIKPVPKDRLFLSLRTAAQAVDRRNQLEGRLILLREREEGMRNLVEAAFLQAVMLGGDAPDELGRYLEALDLDSCRANVGAAAFLSPPGQGDPRGPARSAHRALCSAVRYKTRALVGPLVSGHCALFLPLQQAEDGADEVSAVSAAVESALPGELGRGRVRLAFAPPCQSSEAPAAWGRALRALSRGEAPELGTTGALSPDELLDDEEDFLEAVENMAPERASLALERICLSFERGGSPSEGRRYRMASLLGAAYRILEGRKALSPIEVEDSYRFGDILAAVDGSALGLVAKARFQAMRDAMERLPRGSDPVKGAIAFIEANYEKQLTLEAVADTVAMSPSRLGRLLALEAGKGFSEMLIDCRIERAKELLSSPDAVIKQVSLACGYPDQNYFARLFKKKTGLTPTSFATIATPSPEPS